MTPLAEHMLLFAKLGALAFCIAVVECLRRLCLSQFSPGRVWRRNRVLRRQFDGPQPSSWLLGNLAEASWCERRHRVILDWANQHGPVYHLRLAWINVVVISDPAIVAEVLHSREFDKVPEAYGAVSKMMSDKGMPDLVSGMTDEWWRLFRKGLAPAFNPASIRAGFKHTAAACSELIDVLIRKIDEDPTQPIDMDQACLSETMQVISSFAFGAQMNAVARFGRGEVAELTDIMHRAELEVERRLADPTRDWVWWLTAEGRRETALFAQFQAIMRGLLADMRQRLGPEPPETDVSLGARMLRLRDPSTGQLLPDDRLLPHIGMLFFAGHDTTGHTMAWTLFHIATNPEVEAKVTAELAAEGLLATPTTPQPRPLQHDDLSKLTYLGAAIKEAMRCSPAVATATIRVCQQDCTLGGGRYHIPAGTGLWTPIAAVHNSKAVWGPDADEYRPVRWLHPGADYAQPSTGGAQPSAAGDLGSKSNGAGAAPAGERVGDVAADSHVADESAAGTANGGSGSKARSYELNVSRAQDGKAPKRFIPFSDGRRDCIGQALAKMNYTAVLAMLLGRFHFELAPEMGGPEGVAAAEHMAMTLQPGGGLLMHVTRRDSMPQ